MNPRYEAFKAEHGDQRMWVYLIFINRMKVMYTGSLYNPIFNHDEFTAFVQKNASNFNIDREGLNAMRRVQNSMRRVKVSK